MKTVDLKAIHQAGAPAEPFRIQGWVRSHRTSKQVSFIEFSDGTSIRNLQLVVDPNLPSYAAIASRVTTGAAIEAVGSLVESPAAKQKFEFRVAEIRLIGEADPETYPLQKKGHTLEFLREIQHLRPRTNTIGSVFRVRSAAALAIHRFFNEQGFYYIHTPIITTSDCEGAGEMFHVTTLDLANPPKIDGRVDFAKDFFAAEAGLTVSGQLEGEITAMALKKIYTFGPTFRAESP